MDARTKKIATVALHLAQQDNMREAAGYVERLNGTDGLIDAILGWIDTYIAYCHPTHKEGEAIRIAWVDVDAATVHMDADDVHFGARWAGRLIAARAADDQGQFLALLRSLPAGAALGDGIVALLRAVALGLNGVGYKATRSTS
jgi:hypothetical protein